MELLESCNKAAGGLLVGAYCTVCWRSALNSKTRTGTFTYKYCCTVSTSQYMRVQVQHAACRSPCWVMQTANRPLWGAQWLKTIGIWMNWCDVCINSCLSVGRRLQRWKTGKNGQRKGGKEDEEEGGHGKAWESQTNQSATVWASLMNVWVVSSTY